MLADELERLGGIGGRCHYRAMIALLGELLDGRTLDLRPAWGLLTGTAVHIALQEKIGTSSYFLLTSLVQGGWRYLLRPAG